MSNTPRNLTRNQLAEFLPNARAVRALEQLLEQVSTLLPSDIATINRLIEETYIEAVSGTSKAQVAIDLLGRSAQTAETNAGNADAKATAALDMLNSIARSLEMLAKAPVAQPVATSLQELSDTSIKLPATGNLLAYDATLKQWKNGSVSVEIHAAASKTPPVDADEIPLADSASSFSLKKLTWANLKTTIATYLSNIAFAIGTTTPAAGKFTSLTTTLPSVFSGTLKVGATTYNPYGVAFTGGYHVGWTNAADTGVGAYFQHNTGTNGVALIGGALSAHAIKINAAGGYTTNDGSTGIGATLTTASLVGKTMTFKDGILVSFI